MGTSRPSSPACGQPKLTVRFRLTAVIQLFDLLAPDRSLRAAGYWSAMWRRFECSEHPPSANSGHPSVCIKGQVKTDGGCRDFRPGSSKPVTEFCKFNVGYVTLISTTPAPAPGQQRAFARPRESDHFSLSAAPYSDVRQSILQKEVCHG
jgi:hypothetical protein